MGVRVTGTMTAGQLCELLERHHWSCNYISGGLRYYQNYNAQPPGCLIVPMDDPRAPVNNRDLQELLELVGATAREAGEYLLAFELTAAGEEEKHEQEGVA